MKKFVLAAALTAIASTAFAGSMSEPMMEPEVIVEDTTTNSSHAFLVPLLALLFAAAAASN